MPISHSWKPPATHGLPSARCSFATARSRPSSSSARSRKSAEPREAPRRDPRRERLHDQSADRTRSRRAARARVRRARRARRSSSRPPACCRRTSRAATSRCRSASSMTARCSSLLPTRRTSCSRTSFASHSGAGARLRRRPATRSSARSAASYDDATSRSRRSSPTQERGRRRHGPRPRPRAPGGRLRQQDDQPRRSTSGPPTSTSRRSSARLIVRVTRRRRHARAHRRSRSHSQSAVTSRLKIMGGLDIAERRAPQDGRVSIRRGYAVRSTCGSRCCRRRTARRSRSVSSTRVRHPTRSKSSACGRAAAQLLRARDRPAVRRGRRRRTDRVGQDDDALRAASSTLNTPDRTLMTIEDPVEYRAAGLDQIEVNPRAGLTFATGLRTILRSDPDVILVGEIRDEETAQIAFRAAMTGHLVLTTLHAQTAASAIQRLLDIDDRRRDHLDLDQLHRRPAARAPVCARTARAVSGRARRSC